MYEPNLTGLVLDQTIGYYASSRGPLSLLHIRPIVRPLGSTHCAHGVIRFKMAGQLASSPFKCVHTFQSTLF